MAANTTYALTLILVLLLGYAARLELFYPDRNLQIVRKLSTYIRKHELYVGFVVLVALFFLTRLPFLLHPIVEVAPDSASYFLSLSNRSFPIFAIRPPGYPLYILLVGKIFDGWLPVVIGQHLLSLASGLFLSYGLYAYRRQYLWPSVFVVLGYWGNPYHLWGDMSVLSDSLYTSLLISVLAWFLLAFSSRRPLHFGFASGFMAAVVLVRPSGLFLVVIYFLLLLFLLYNRYSKKSIGFFAVPFPMILLLLCTYNRITVGEFTVSAFGEANLAGATVVFWTPPRSLPPPVYESITQNLPLLLEERGFSPREKEILYRSWNPDSLYYLYSKYYSLWSNASAAIPHRGYLQKRAYLKQIVLHSIKENPNLYIKFVWSNAFVFFKNIHASADMYSHLEEIVNIYTPSGIESRFKKLQVLREYNAKTIPYEPNIRWTDDRYVLEETPWNPVYKSFEAIYTVFYGSVLWIFIFFAVFLRSFFMLLKSGFKDSASFLPFIISLFVLGACLVTSLVEVALPRYSYPTQAIFYLTLVLSFRNRHRIGSRS